MLMSHKTAPPPIRGRLSGGKSPQKLLNGLQLLEQHAVQGFVAGDDLAIPDRARLAGIVRDQATGFLDHEQARGHVPWLQTGFPERVEAPGGEPGHVDRNRT